MAALLSDIERRKALAELDGWEETPDGKAIVKRFKFKSFNEAFGFMTRAALARRKWTIIRSGPMFTIRWRSNCRPTAPKG
jgi:pterin-4a-carbinolamine dehydratase